MRYDHAMVRIALAACLVVAACSSESPPTGQRVAPADAARLLIDRNWIDRLPETPQDRLHVYRFVPSMGGGVFQDRTLFKGQFELFTFVATGDRIRIVTPEDETTHDTAYRIDRIENGPEGTDLRLTLDDPRAAPRSTSAGARRPIATGPCSSPDCAISAVRRAKRGGPRAGRRAKRGFGAPARGGATSESLAGA